MQGAIDYTLAKRAVIANFRKGGLSRLDICDAHPELMRAAKNIGACVNRTCPVCDKETLRQVRYVYGDQLKTLSGRIVYPEDMVQKLVTRFEEFRCYAVEVCVECGWNHLTSCQLVGRRFSADSDARTKGVSSLE